MHLCIWVGATIADDDQTVIQIAGVANGRQHDAPSDLQARNVRAGRVPRSEVFLYESPFQGGSVGRLSAPPVLSNPSPVSYRRRLAYNCSDNDTIGSEHRNASYEVFRTNLVDLKFGPFANKVYTATNSRFVPRSGSKIPRMRSCRYFIRTTCRSLNQGALEAGGAFACRSTCSRLRGSAAL
jgi:hypothetical protein